MNMNERMFNNELRHLCPFMPSRVIHPEIDGLSFEAIHNLPQNLNKPFGIAANPLHDPMRSLDEIHPSKDIQPLLVLTPGIDKRSTPLLRPYSSQFRMQRKPRLILKKNHPIILTSQSRPEFFLMSPEILPPLLPWPAQNGTSAVSANIPISSSISGHDEHESQYDMPSSDIPQKLRHPISPWKFRNSAEILIKPRPAWRFRTKPATDSDPNRPPVPIQIGRAFRIKSATPLKGEVTLDN
jgi:hypothetical protein